MTAAFPQHSSLCAINSTGHRGPCTCGADKSSAASVLDCRYETGTVLVWEPDKPHARCVVEVTETRWNGEEWWIATEDICGGDTHWNEERRVDEAAVLYGDWKERPL